ncbi:MAG: helix-turn-helix domain-containing protein [Xanthomonadaceae bacterium]|nr:helix-turn-helix domain-containing protein [Xanthomonadaceae bacterium]
MFGAQIREQRKSMKLSQSALSSLSGVSVPMIQLIESEKGNPSIKTLVMILDSLHMKLVCKEEKFNWDRFARHTALLYEQGTVERAFCTEQTLVSCLIAAGETLAKEKDQRKKEALESTLLALELYYPDFYRQLLVESSALKKLCAFSISGRHIKLKRIALERLKDYL